MSRFHAKGISAAYGRKTILTGINLPEMKDGGILGLLGPNASGKSTLMRCLSGEKDGPGNISLNGLEKSPATLKQWRNLVATMPQSPPSGTALMPTELIWSTARALGLGLSDAQLGARIETIFSSLGLAEFALAPLHSLSGGKRQLVGLTLAIIREPRLLLLDEPTSALDLHWRLAVLELVRDYVGREKAIAIAALHDLDLAARYCDRLVLINGGRVVASGTPAEVLTPENLAAVYHVEARIDLSDPDQPSVHILRPLKPSEETAA